MSMELLVTISAITEFIVLSAICLTLINAFSHGALAKLVFGSKAKPEAKSTDSDQGSSDEPSYLRAA